MNQSAQSSALTDRPSGDASRPAPAGVTALRNISSHLRLWLIAVFGLGIDLWSKAWAFETLNRGEHKDIIPGVLRMELSLNAGALFGMGTGLAWLFIVASVAALGFVLYLFAGSTKSQRGVHVALALILAGALGNLYDRTFNRYTLVPVRSQDSSRGYMLIGHIADHDDPDAISIFEWGTPVSRVIPKSDLAGEVRQAGVVRDFLKFTLAIGGRPVWPWVFNIADAYLVAGVILLLLRYFLEYRRHGGNANVIDATAGN